MTNVELQLEKAADMGFLERESGAIDVTHLRRYRYEWLERFLSIRGEGGADQA